MTHISSSDKFIISTNYFDETYILSHIEDTCMFDMWLKSNDVSYLLVDDICSFPKFSCISMIPEIRKIIDIQNAGGSSELSEIISMQYMNLMYHAHSFVPEMEIKYCEDTKMCDYIMTIQNTPIGVSVTRAMGHPSNNNLSLYAAMLLLYKKLIGLKIAHGATYAVHKFDKSIIHIWCHSLDDIANIKSAYSTIVETDIYGLYCGIQVICSLCTNTFIYSNSQHD